jgi:hypothetical protein
MSEPSIELIVREIITKRSKAGTTTNWVRLVTVDADKIAFHEVALGDDLTVAAALTDAKWRYTRLRVPTTFFAQDDAKKREILKQALASHRG